MEEILNFKQSKDVVISDVNLISGRVGYFGLKAIDHEINQDGLLIITDDFYSGLFVADGMGGHQKGEEASAIILQVIAEQFKNKNNEIKKLKKAHDSGKVRNYLRALVVDSLYNADEKIKGLKVGAGATFVGAICYENTVQFLNSGDAIGALVGGKGKLKYKTIEHSIVGHAIEAGLIEEGSETAQEKGNIISNGVGFDVMRVEVSQSMALSPQDIVLVYSDGINNILKNSEIYSLMSSGPFKSRVPSLFNKINLNRNEYLIDDSTIICYQHNF